MVQEKDNRGVGRRGYGTTMACGAASLILLFTGVTPALAGTTAAAPPTTPVAAAASTIGEIRDALQAAHDRDGSGPFEGVIPFLAEDVETLHTPPFPGDRTMKGAVMAKFLPLEHSLANAAIEGRRMDVAFTVQGNDIVMKGVLTGKLRGSGKLLVQPIKVTWTITDGKITRFVADASTPEGVEGYRLKGEAYSHPAVRPLMDAMMAAMSGK